MWTQFLLEGYEKVESYSYEGTNYIGGSCKEPSNYLSTTAPIKDLNRMDLNSR